jgi:putative peptidoglycan lipid II flippase
MGPAPKHCFRLWEPANRVVLGNAFPYLMGGLIMNSAVIVDQAMAAWLESGSVSVLTYSDKVCGIVLALTATAASEAVFPFFADSVARREWRLVKKHLLQVTGAILLFAVPIAVIFILFAPQIVGLLFERGSFTSADTAKVAGVMRFAAMQIPFYIAGILASRVAVSMEATRFTLVASISALACNITFNWILMQRMGVAGIALSTAFVHLLSAASLYIYIFRKVGLKEREDELAVRAINR